MRYWVVFFCMLFFQNASGREGSERRLQEVAHGKEWLRLLHYKKTWFGYRSELDGPSFFFSPEGSSNPQAELQASLKAIQENTVTVGKFNLSPRCSFPERTRFLNEAFQLQLPPAPCPLFESFMERFHNPQGVSLVFSSAYPNNPASMFGHTFLKIKSDRDTDLLDNGVNFAAAVSDDENPFAFLYFGVSGGYAGQWSVQPYYVKVREYINFESRDLWEYELNLSVIETQRLLAHLWELEINSYFDYYFFDENCSYQVLKAIEAVKPEWTLDHHKIYMIPGESIKFALRQEGVLKSVKYRPSLYKKMWQKYEILQPPERKQMLALVAGAQAVEQVASRPVLESAIGYLDYLKNEDKKHYEKNLQGRHGEILRRRAQLGPLTTGEERRYPELPGTTRPDQGHDSFYWQGGVGHRYYSPASNETFSRFRLRSSYHDLLNRDLGYSPFSHIEFPSIEFQYNDRNRRFRVEEVLGLATTSLTPVNDLRFPWSYRMAVAYKTDREYNLRCDECDLTVAEAGPGVTWALGSDTTWVYALGLIKASLGAHLMEGYDYGVGVELGLLFNPVDRYKLHMEVRSFCDLHEFSDCQQRASFGIGQSLSLGRNLELKNLNRWVFPDSRLGESYGETSINLIQFFN